MIKPAPIKLVLDTNTVLSAFLFNKGSLAWLRVQWHSGRLQPLASKATITELLRVLNYPKFKLTSSDQQDLLSDYLPYVTTVKEVELLKDKTICRDINDVMFLALAIAGNAQYLVTEDKDLLEIKIPFAFEIITPVELKQLIL